PAARPPRTGLQHDEPRQAVALTAEAVGEPRTHARAAELRAAGVDEALRRTVVEHVRLHPAKPAHVVGDLAVLREQLADVHAALPGLAELADRAEELGVALDEREPFALRERLGDALPVELVEFGFGLEEFELRRRAGHEQVDDGLRLRLEV